MTDHLNPRLNQGKLLTEICKKISATYQADFSNCARLLGGQRVCLITPQNELFQYLDSDSKYNFFNWLIFKEGEDVHEEVEEEEEEDDDTETETEDEDEDKEVVEQPQTQQQQQGEEKKEKGENVEEKEEEKREEKKDEEVGDKGEQEDSSITVICFGPFGSGEDKEYKDTVDKTNRSLTILKSMWNALKSHDNEDSEVDEDKEREDVKREFIEVYWAMVHANELEIEARKEELEDFTRQVYDKPEDQAAAQELIGKISASTGKMVIKTVTATIAVDLGEKIIARIAAITAAKSMAKTAAKGGSKGTGKATAKAIPFVGAVVGAGFGIWRLFQGDVTGAGLEIASGAASCVPGSGTVASLAIDASLVAKDIYEANDVNKKYLEVRNKLFDLNEEKTESRKKPTCFAGQFETYAEINPDRILMSGQTLG